LDDLTLAKSILRDKSSELVVVRDGRILFIGRSRGLRDLAEIVLKDPRILRGSAIADQVVGKAAGVIFLANGVKAVHGCLMSVHGLEILEKGQVKISYDKVIDQVKSPSGDICPFEKLILNIDDVDEAYNRLLTRIREVFGAGENVI